MVVEMLVEFIETCRDMVVEPVETPYAKIKIMRSLFQRGMFNIRRREGGEMNGEKVVGVYFLDNIKFLIKHWKFE